MFIPARAITSRRLRRAPDAAPPRFSAVVLSAALVFGLVCLSAPACGKKGPPLAPLMRVPAPAGEFSARRLGTTVYLRFVIPAKNQDNSTPADISGVEVYGYTGRPANDEDMVEYGTLVASVPVRPPPRDDEDRTKKTPPKEPRANEAQPPPGFEQGTAVAVTETLTPELMQAVVVKRRTKQNPSADVRQPPVLLTVASFDDIRSRVYVAVGVNHRGRRGVFSQHAAVPVIALPAAPSGLHATYTETQIKLEWTPPPGAPLPARAGTKADYLRSRPIVPVAAPAWFYDVFEVPAPGAAPPRGPSPAATPPELPRVEPPLAVNQQPLAAPEFADPRIEFGVERCYAVRTINAFGKLQQESEPSEVTCVTPRDTFPPAAPRGLIAVASEGVISLSWEPNTEGDLAGYLVLRAEAADAPLQPMFREPIHATTFEDKTVKPGVRYVYAVVALDKATPPNIGKESNRIEETAR